MVEETVQKDSNLSSDRSVDGAVEQAVVRAIAAMRHNVGGQFTIDDMARAAMFSKFHFSRVFRRVTGISPGRFLSAMRLQEAKRLLVSTSLSVTDISHRVGYSSVGTFSSRFSSSVGMAPSAYRQLRGFTSDIPTGRRRGAAECRSTTVRGKILFPDPVEHGLIFGGLFPDPIPQGAPVRCTVLREEGEYVLRDVPVGTWHFLVHAVPPGCEEVAQPPSGGDQSIYVGACGPLTIRSGSPVDSADVQLRPIRIVDPPVLLALLDMRSGALKADAG